MLELQAYVPARDQVKLARFSSASKAYDQSDSLFNPLFFFPEMQAFLDCW